MASTLVRIDPDAVGEWKHPQAAPPLAAPNRLPPVPWRDPHTVPADELEGHISMLEQACARHPESADLRTCLGMAYAMNFQAYQSMDALAAAVALDPASFWAQFKYAELHYRLRALEEAEALTLKALALAQSGVELALARRQLGEIRRLRREGTQRPAFTKPLARPAAAFLAMLAAVALMMVLR